MTSARMDTIDAHARLFEAERRTLEGLAYRMLGARADAQDLVQETWLRWRGVELAEVRDPRAWLVTACSRLCLDTLRSARVRRETYVGQWLPEPWVADVGNVSSDVLDTLELDETVSVALLVALERLSPPERAAFLLYDVFGFDFDEIAGMLDRTSVSCRKLASRARTRVRDAAPRKGDEPSAAEHRKLLDAFHEAARDGDIDALRRLLAADVELHADGGGRVSAVREVLQGPDQVASFLVAIWRQLRGSGAEISLEPTWFNGTPGLLMRDRGELLTAWSAHIEGGVLRRIYALRNPDKLGMWSSPVEAGGEFRAEVADGAPGTTLESGEEDAAIESAQ